MEWLLHPYLCASRTPELFARVEEKFHTRPSAEKVAALGRPSCEKSFTAFYKNLITVFITFQLRNLVPKKLLPYIGVTNFTKNCDAH